MEDAPKLWRSWVQQVVRDVLAVSGFVELGKSERIKQVIFNSAAASGRGSDKLMQTHCIKDYRMPLEAGRLSLECDEPLVFYA